MPRWLLGIPGNEPQPLLEHLLDGSTREVEGVTRGAKTVAGSKVFSPAPGATTIPDASEIAAGKSILQAGLVWGSATAAVPTETGPGVLTQAQVLALSNLELVASAAAVSSNGQSTGAVLVVPSVVNTQHYMYLSMTPYAGHKLRCSFRWKPNHALGAMTCLQTINAGGPMQLYYLTGTSPRVVCPGGGGSPVIPTAGVHQIRHWIRSDGWLESELIWPAVAGNLVWYISNAGAISYAGDGVSGTWFDRIEISEVQPLVLQNLATGSAATITAVAGTAPFLEKSLLAEDGWIANGLPTVRFLGVEDRYFSLSAECYTAAGGTVRLTWVAQPWQVQDADGKVWYFAGADASVLSVEQTTTAQFRVTRITGAGVPTSATFATVVGNTPVVYSVALDGSNALLLRQGVLVETVPFPIVGAVTFTSGRFGGAVKCAVQDFHFSDTVGTLAEIRSMHVALAVRCGISIERKKIILMLGQSNETPNMLGDYLPTFGSPGRNLRAIHYEGVLSAWPNEYAGWGPSRTYHHTDRIDSTNQYLDSFALDVGAQGSVGPEVGFHQGFGDCATARFAIVGQPLWSYLDGQANCAAMRAAFDDAVATIGMPYEVVGLLIEAGESDAADILHATQYGETILTLLAELSTRYANDNPLWCCVNLLHQATAALTAYPYGGTVRSKVHELADTDLRIAIVNGDDLPLKTDVTHLGGDLQAYDSQYQIGLRYAAAALRLGA